MRLSELSSNEGYDALLDCLDPICNIAEDESVLEIVKEMQIHKGENPIKSVVRGLKGAKAILKNHKSDVFEVLASLNRQTVKDYKSTHSILQVINEIYDICTDDIFPEVFPSAQMRGHGESSSSAQVVTLEKEA